ncbi:MAG: uracil-DNA glycosylase [Oscillatoriaceae cyanobacterium Prado104]|nr:uracil-DNA glycosylase [Oscillatoriaceae cyanobacterium Prado104]
MSDDLQLSLFDSSQNASIQADSIPANAKVPIPAGTYQSIEQIAEHCNRCHRCELGNTRTHAVIGRGNPEALILIVGEAPGQNEANVIKCRPPNNRPPTAKEIEACKPYLLEQIRILDPKIILLTGATALKGLINDKRAISKIRGQWIEWENRLCMPIFHPSYLLRNPSREPESPKWLMWQDIQAVKAKLDEIKTIT